MYSPIAVFCAVLLRETLASPRVDVQQTHPYRTSENQLRYEYRYSLDDGPAGVVSDTWEERRGEVVKGSYSLLEPGGKIRSVSYQVDPDKGFQAIVKTSIPGLEYLSSQLYHRSLELHPEVVPELQLKTRAPIIDHDPPINYHAINAAILGSQKLRLGESPRNRIPLGGHRFSRRRS